MYLYQFRTGKLHGSCKVTSSPSHCSLLPFWNIPSAWGRTVTNIWPQALLKPRESFCCMCVFSQNYKAQQLLVPEAVAVSVFFDYSLVITYPPEHLQGRFIKQAFMNFGKGFMGTAGYGVQSLYLQIKNIL